MKQIRPNLVLPLVLVSVLTWLFRDPIRSGMALLAAGLVADSAVAAPQSRGSFNGFDVSNATIPTREILSSGPPSQPVRDQINSAALDITFHPGSQLTEVRRVDSGELLPSVKVYWFAWQASYPQTGLWRPE